MFLTNRNSGYNRDGEQFAQGYFLVVVQHPTAKEMRPELRCIVRFVRMTQCGHWMMASCQLGKHRIVLSGDYGGDGLPIYLRHKKDFARGEKGKGVDMTPEEIEKVWNSLHEIPAELQTAFWEGGGHNEGGSEKPKLRAWAKPLMNKLKKPNTR